MKRNNRCALCGLMFNSLGIMMHTTSCAGKTREERRKHAAKVERKRDSDMVKEMYEASYAGELTEMGEGAF